MKTCKEYRLYAEKILKNNYCTMILMSLLYGAILSACMGSILLGILLDGALMVGLCIANMKLVRGEKVKVKDLFEAFDNCDLTSTIGLSVKTAVFTLLWSLLFIIPGIIAALGYAMAPYIIAEHPEIKAYDAIKMSKTMMKGNKGKLFMLELSFIGWYLLCVLTFGIGFFFLNPYIHAAKAEFFNEVSGKNYQKSIEYTAPDNGAATAPAQDPEW